MRLGYFTMPMHPQGRNWEQTLREDREAVILADRLGFHDVFIGEHLTDSLENITNSMMFLCSVVAQTKYIKLGTGTTNLSHMHPVLIAANAAMLDHMSGGRMILGISPGALASDAEALGIFDEDRNKLFEECIDAVLAIWNGSPPYDIELPNNRFRISTKQTIRLDLGLGILPKPLQQPRPEIVGTVVAPFSKGVIAMGKRDFHPLSANFLLSKWLPGHWDNYAQGKAEVGLVANRSDWRIARSIFVADTDAVAAAYGRHDAASPYTNYYRQILAKLARNGRQGVFKSHKDQPDDEVTLDYVLDNCMVYGTPEKIVDYLLQLHEETGGFGELVYAGMDWSDRDLAQRSMTLMAEKVMPKVRAALRVGEEAIAK